LNRTKDVLRASYRAAENAILQPGGTAGRTEDPSRLRFPEAHGCTFCGHCFQGCTQPIDAPRNLVAKRSTDNSYIPMALTADAWAPAGKPIELVADAFVTKIETAGGGDRPVAGPVTWRDGKTGDTHTESARVVVLAAGPIESPRLWLNSELPNPNDWVGRGLTDHYTDIVAGLLPGDGGGGRGPTASTRADFPGLGSILSGTLPPAPIAQFVATGDSGINGFYDDGSPEGLEGTEMRGRLIGRQMKDWLSDLSRIFVIVCLTDDDVEPGNRVTLSNNPPDDHGRIPKVSVNHRNRTARTLENRRELVRRGVEIAKAAGASQLLRVNPAPLLVHIHSTMRMGTSESDSVVDGWGEARAVDNLYIADNSALANSVGGMNPTLTTQALATRTAERIFQQHFDGDPWVESESPVSSIDDSVTRAVLARGI
jgi:choline dehydrogenase-like flavoprotein